MEGLCIFYFRGTGHGDKFMFIICFGSNIFGEVCVSASILVYTCIVNIVCNMQCALTVYDYIDEQ